MFSRRIARGFKHKTDHLQNSLESAYDLLNHRSYFHMLHNITNRVNLYNKQVAHLEDPADEELALEYLTSLNGTKKYEDVLLFASKWKYSWYSNMFNFYGSNVSADGSEIIIRPVRDRSNRKLFRKQVNYAKEKLGHTIHRSMLLYSIVTCISFMILVFPESTLDWFFWGKQRFGEAGDMINDKLDGKDGKKGKTEGPEKDLGKKVFFKDVIGIDEFKDELMEIVDYLKHPEKYEEMGAYVPKGVLLCGRPGTGKTMLAQALANEAECSFIYKSGAEFDQIFVGSGARNVRDLFKKARKKAPAIIFIDEIDSIGGKRQQESNNTLNQLLVEIDGFRKDDRIILVGATNLADSLDSALTRPGRFDKKITIPSPDRKGREKLFEHYLSEIPLYKQFQSDLNVRKVKKQTKQREGMEKLSKDLAAITPNFTGAEIKNIVNLTLCHTVLKRERLTPAYPLPSLKNFRQVLSEIKSGPKKLIGN
jgi:ATP-dependent Zn protease